MDQPGEPMLCNYLNFKETPFWVFPNQRIASFGSLEKNQNERVTAISQKNILKNL
jgi:hypothetical protein